MNKVIPLIGIAVASIFASRAAMQLSDLPILDRDKPAEKQPKASAEPRTERRDSSRDEPAYKALIRCLSDLDDILDSIVNPATFVTVKPLLLKRVREHVAQASEHPQGMAKLSKAASQEMQQAVNRHSASLIRANQVAPGVNDFFSQQLAAILNPK